jgi:hypothetical protein
MGSLAGCPLLIIEGDRAGRREVAHLIDTLIWVQADERETGRRAAARAANRPAADLANRAVVGAPFDEDGWMAEEISFNTAQRTWNAPALSSAAPADPLRPGHRNRHRAAYEYIPLPGPAPVPGRLAALRGRAPSGWPRRRQRLAYVKSDIASVRWCTGVRTGRSTGRCPASARRSSGGAA